MAGAAPRTGLVRLTASLDKTFVIDTDFTVPWAVHYDIRERVSGGVRTNVTEWTVTSIAVRFDAEALFDPATGRQVRYRRSWWQAARVRYTYTETPVTKPGEPEAASVTKRLFVASGRILRGESELVP
jgi:hypothetical protein